jgi:hypothetical protein
VVAAATEQEEAEEEAVATEAVADAAGAVQAAVNSLLRART